MVSAAGVAAPVATIKAYRRKGGAIVAVERRGWPPRRYRITLKRYHALREWAAFGQRSWKTSGAYMRSRMVVSLWPTH